jgi:hypothetical protein
MKPENLEEVEKLLIKIRIELAGAVEIQKANPFKEIRAGYIRIGSEVASDLVDEIDLLLRESL